MQISRQIYCDFIREMKLIMVGKLTSTFTTIVWKINLAFKFEPVRTRVNES